MHSPAECESTVGADSDGSILLSIIIPAKNEGAMIGRCLDGISALRLPRTQFEVIVVDNGSTDRTVAIADSYAPRLQLRTILHPTGYVSAVRNTGAAAARGEIILFLDADCILRPDWAENALQALGQPGVGAVGGPVLPEGSSWIVRDWFENDLIVKVGEVEYLGTAALAMRREVFERVGRFNETLETNEDFELCLRTRQAGLSIQAVPELAITHLRVPQTLRQFFRRERWHGTHVFRVFLENLGALANVRAVGFGFFTLFCLAGLAVGMFRAATAGSFAWLIGSSAALLGVCILLTIRMLRKHPSRVSPRLLASLLLLHLVYGIARASALLRVRAWIPKQRPRQTPEAQTLVGAAKSSPGRDAPSGTI